jgi:pilus assembly protein CpaB
MLILGLAAVAAGVIALVAHGLVSDGPPKVEAAPQPKIHMTEVLVASTALIPGRAVTADQVRWQSWPSNAVDKSFITKSSAQSLGAAIEGGVVRAPMVEGEPITDTKIVRGDPTGFLAATLTPGTRAVSIQITTESGAGGFILPNDHVDVILTRVVSDASPKVVSAKAILRNVRVLAIDQTFKEDKDQKTVTGKSATLELSPAQADLVSASQASGVLSLSLRALGDTAKDDETADSSQNGTVNVIRFGRSAEGGGGKN